MISLESIARQINADSASLMVPNKAERHTFCYANYNMPSEWIGIKNSFDENVPGGNIEVYKTGEPEITNHLNKTIEGHHIESVMIVPLIRNGKAIAMLELIRGHNKDGFTKHDLESALKYAEILESKLNI